MMKSVSLYLYKDTIYLEPYAVTTAGYRISTEPVFTVVKDDITDLAQAILDALAHAGRKVPTPGRNYTPPPVLKSAGVRSWKSFARVAEHCSIRESDGAFTLTPYVHAEGDSFEPVTVREQHFNKGIPPTELARAVLRVLTGYEAPA